MTELQKLQLVDDALKSANDASLKCVRLFACVKATLLFHDNVPWSAANSEEWTKITGMTEATTRNLCEFIRGQLHAVIEPLASSACTVESWCVRQVGHGGECSPVFVRESSPAERLNPELHVVHVQRAVMREVQFLPEGVTRAYGCELYADGSWKLAERGWGVYLSRRMDGTELAAASQSIFDQRRVAEVRT